MQEERPVLQSPPPSPIKFQDDVELDYGSDSEEEDESQGNDKNDNNDLIDIETVFILTDHDENSDVEHDADLLRRRAISTEKDENPDQKENQEAINKLISGQTLSENAQVEFQEIQDTIVRDLTSEQSLNLETVMTDKSRQGSKKRSRDQKPKTRQSDDVSKVDKSVTETKDGKEEEAGESPSGVKTPWPFNPYSAVDVPEHYLKTASAKKQTMKDGKVVYGFEKVGSGARSKRKDSSSSAFLAETPRGSVDYQGDPHKEIARLTNLLELQRSLNEKKPFRPQELEGSDRKRK